MTRIGETDPFLQPRFRLVLRGAQEQEVTVEARLDTGFSGYLAVPRQVIAALGLTAVSARQMRLADGTLAYFDEYKARVVWDGYGRPVRVLAVDRDALAGVALFLGCRLCIEFLDGGTVTMEEIL